jgi:DNA-binding transcriptional MerR regulator
MPHIMRNRSDGKAPDEDGFDADSALREARASRAARSGAAHSDDGEDDGLFPITADLTLGRGDRGDREPDADGVVMTPGDIVVAADDPRRETIDDPRIPPDKLFFKIGEVSRLTGLKPYVLRYWETEFPWIRPSKTSSRQRLYRRQDICVLLEVKRLRYEEKRTIADTKERIRERRGLERAKRPSKLPRKVVSVAPRAALAPTSLNALNPILRELRQELADLIAFVDGHAARA